MAESVFVARLVGVGCGAPPAATIAARAEPQGRLAAADATVARRAGRECRRGRRRRSLRAAGAAHESDGRRMHWQRRSRRQTPPSRLTRLTFDAANLLRLTAQRDRPPAAASAPRSASTVPFTGGRSWNMMSHFQRSDGFDACSQCRAGTGRLNASARRCRRRPAAGIARARSSRGRRCDGLCRSSGSPSAAADVRRESASLRSASPGGVIARDARLHRALVVGVGTRPSRPTPRPAARRRQPAPARVSSTPCTISERQQPPAARAR